MSWTNVNLNDVPTGRELLPGSGPADANGAQAPADYTLQVLPGSKFSDKDPGKVEVNAAVVGGEFNGRRAFISYPDPAKQEWSPVAFKRLTVAIGVDVEPGESPVAYLNRVAGLHFVMPIGIRVDNENVPRQDYKLFNPKPARH